MPTYHTFLNSPLGKLRLRATEKSLIAVDHTNQQRILAADCIENPAHPILLQASSELEEYFSGTRTEFHTPLAPAGTAFQQHVWQALLTIPHGQTTSYSDIAQMLNTPNAVRATGTAIGRNPISIFIPCHRIIGKNGTLTGYAGGLENKQILLELERKQTCFNLSNEAY